MTTLPNVPAASRSASAPESRLATDPILLELMAARENLQRTYAEVLGFPRIWETARRQIPAADKRLREAGLEPERPVGLATSTGADGLTVHKHLETARIKAEQPPRLALVGAFSTGKSTLLNALLHSKAFNDLLHRSLGLKGQLLETGLQATTGNVTELQFSGDKIPEGAAPADLARLFTFEVTYLSENELREQFRYVAGKLGLGVAPQTLEAPDWIDRLLATLPHQLAARYNQETLEDQRRNLIVLHEILRSLGKPDLRRLLGRENVALGEGKAGLEHFQRLQERKAIDLKPRWADVQFWENEFHLVKLLRLRFPHPDFVGQRFALFDFPGLGSGMYRDDFISQEFIPEANVILVPFLRTAVGGGAINHIIDVFKNRRAGMGVKALLERVYFVNAQHPEKSPLDATTQVDFFRDFLQAVSNLLRPIVAGREADPERQKALYREYLNHFLGCDGLVGGYYRSEKRDPTAEAAQAKHQTYRDKCFFQVPTDLATLERLARDPVLTNPAGGFPLLASMLTDPAISQAVADMFRSFESNAGIDALVQKLREFVSRNAERIKAEDVWEHLRAAAGPLSALRGLQPPEAAGEISVAALSASQSFDRCLEWERRWLRTLEIWSKYKGFNLALNPPETAAVLKRLDEAQLGLEQRIRQKVEEVVSAAGHERFCQKLQPLRGALLAWIGEKSAGSRLPSPGGLPGPGARAPLPATHAGGLPTPGGRAQAERPAAPLRLDHTLTLYRYYLQCRKDMLKFFHQELFPPFLAEVTKIYLESGGNQWKEFNEVWGRVQALASQRQSEADGDGEVLALAEGIGRDYSEFLYSPDGYFRDARSYLRVVAEIYLNPQEWNTCGGLLYESLDVPGGQRLVLGEWTPEEPMPANSKQLAAWLTRMRLPLDTARTQKREAVTLPELDEKGINRVLAGIGLVDDKETLQRAPASADFWTNPLPQLAGKALRQGPAGEGMLHWNPVPFDLFAGNYLTAADANGVPPWMQSVRNFLALLFGELAVKFALFWKRDGYLEKWQQGLLITLEDLQGNERFWRWIDNNRQNILKVDPLEAKLLELQHCLNLCDRLGLFAPRGMASGGR